MYFGIRQLETHVLNWSRSHPDVSTGEILRGAWNGFVQVRHHNERIAYVVLGGKFGSYTVSAFVPREDGAADFHEVKCTGLDSFTEALNAARDMMMR